MARSRPGSRTPAAPAMPPPARTSPTTTRPSRPSIWRPCCGPMPSGWPGPWSIRTCSIPSGRSSRKSCARTSMRRPMAGSGGSSSVTTPSTPRIYRRSVIGSIEELDSARIEDARAFHEAYYRPATATLIVSGNFDPAQLDALGRPVFRRDHQSGPPGAGVRAPRLAAPDAAPVGGGLCAQRAPARDRGDLSAAWPPVIRTPPPWTS